MGQIGKGYGIIGIRIKKVVERYANFRVFAIFKVAQF